MDCDTPRFPLQDPGPYKGQFFRTRGLWHSNFYLISFKKKIVYLLYKVQFMKHLAENLNCDDVILNLIKIAAYMLNANEMR